MFASTALVLAVIGIFGVVAYFVQQHARDIGIRLALGGTPARVRRMVVFQGMRLVAAGVVVGIGAAVAASRFMSAVVFGVSATDLRMLAGARHATSATATSAAGTPAQRAARLDPADVLRES
jgi:putative ABC transport system permease protein